MNQAHVVTGRVVVSAAVGLITQGAALALAWSFSGWAFVGAALAFSFAATLLGGVIKGLLEQAISAQTFESIGSGMGTAAGKVANLFRRPAKSVEAA